MRSALFASLLLGLCSFHTTAGIAAPSSRDVKVCVRIDEKSWNQDGTRQAAPPKADDAPPTETDEKEPSASSGAETKSPPPKPDPSPTAGGFAAAGVPTEAFPAPPNSTPVPSGAGNDASAAAPREGASSSVPDDIVSEDEADFFVVNPVFYLKRLVEYHVTHEPGFESAASGCSQTLTVELYPVKRGWTVFARYSGNGREEKVDVVRLDELGTFAERVTTALLRDLSISQTLSRTTVLRADSETRVRRVQTRPHFLLAMGSTARFGELPTAPNDVDPARPELRVETPLSFAIGARNKFRAWALDAKLKLDIGLVERAARRSAGGGHVDYSGGAGLGLGFLSYADPDAVNTLYFGAGGSFEISRYQSQGARDRTGYQPEPDGLWGGGLNVDAIVGFEFMRTSALHFFVQLDIAVPAYIFQSENDQSLIRSWIPSAGALVGLLL
jgi:hypothetical protein